ncbi:VOC family protein [Sulfitobacter donghicola]|uniref:Virulence protein n=1 Tax=Sulfitobacter donghicola DSW-25 = KCTC 12864 = JCM 14565 TaxID=1300350 RepID=A0A073IMQ9_9RHOB|nr:VOC family protein [Sulfitobacter donghicola]KEJ90875.1 virulence protein [Sulfitobacter donghicola DSW-25 = KCTC 12864 = JCM 14565]KIN68155.1 Lactoylglutathione lyase [Sulfitobacter donghicola DSW-25 = KCTC 12864 = JCM 14565]
MKPSLKTLDHLVLTVTDIPRTAAFYTQVLGMSEAPFTVADGSTRVALTFGSMKINLHQAGLEFEPKAGRATVGSADLCFLTSAPLDAWQLHLADLTVEIEIGPIRRTGATGPIMSLYIRDPDGNLIEISEQI